MSKQAQNKVPKNKNSYWLGMFGVPLAARRRPPGLKQADRQHLPRPLSLGLAARQGFRQLLTYKVGLMLQKNPT